jgi:plastocyanin
MKIRSISAAVLIVFAIGGTAIGQEANSVVIQNFDFTPMTLAVKAGSTVTWINKDDEPHTVVSEAGLFRSKALDQGDSFAFKFDKPGTYRFLCSIHPKMMGTITVR